ncbi:MAG: large conductance mechanosensitive channel protein MscL [Phototrophicales bacterium]|nr:MAG: large conductance mechanosensitive channel protein MscL [Phototrophicales bacterium]
MQNFLKEFRDFAIKGNVVDLAVAVIIGAAFGAIVNSFVADMIMPVFGYILGDVDFSDLFINLSGGDYQSLEQAKAAGAATINYGVFINTIINFLVIAFALFVVIRQVNRLKQQEEAAAEETPAEPSTEEKLLEAINRLNDYLAKRE